MATKVITRVEMLPVEYQWSTTTHVVDRMVDFRRSPWLSDAVVQTDPLGELILTQQTIDGLASGTAIQQAIDLIGVAPYRDEHPQQMGWYTMGGSYVTVLVNFAKNCVASTSFHDVVAETWEFSKRMSEIDNLQGRRGAVAQLSFNVSTKEIIRYFSFHSNLEQREWLLVAIEAVPSFEICETNYGPRVSFQFDRSKPRFDGEHVFNAELNPLLKEKELEQWSINEFGQTFSGSYFDGNAPEPFGIRNKLTEADAERFWHQILETVSSSNSILRGRAMRAIRACDSSCDPQQRAKLIAHARAARWAIAENFANGVRIEHHRRSTAEVTAKILSFEAARPFKGRDYKKTENIEFWGWYQSLIYGRDDCRCQYCGQRDFEVEGLLHIDHILPLSKGGETRLSNLQLLCAACNCKKGTKVEHEFPPEVRAAWYKNRPRLGVGQS